MTFEGTDVSETGQCCFTLTGGGSTRAREEVREEAEADLLIDAGAKGEELLSADEAEESKIVMEGDAAIRHPPPSPPQEDRSELPLEDVMATVSISGPSSAAATAKSRHHHCGLENLGNTCYINSVLQTLFWAPKIRSHLLKNCNGGTFHQILRRLFTDMRKHSPAAIKPDEFSRQFRRAKPQFLRNEQHDAQECLSLLLDLVHDECNQADKSRKPGESTVSSAEDAWTQHLAAIDDSYFSKVLMGQSESCLTCDTCANRSLSWNCFWQLQIAVNKVKASPEGETQENLSLLDCISEYEEEEELTGDCAPYCEKCGKSGSASKKLTIRRSPHYLIVHLKRFTESGAKIARPVEVCPQFDLAGKRYKLASCVLHRGTEYYGHYTTLVCESDGFRWAHLDDETITGDLPESKALRMMQRHAYLCLFKSVLIADDNVNK